MKFTRIIAIILFALTITASFLPALSVADDAAEITVTWQTSGAGFVRRGYGNYFSMYEKAYTTFDKGHVMTLDDIPDVASDERVKAVGCHFVWKDVLGTAVNEDVTFNLGWVSDTPGECAVVWNSYISGINHRYTTYVRSFPKGYVLQESDIPVLDYQLNDADDLDAVFTWGDIAGTEITENTVFNVICRANVEGRAVLCGYIPQKRIKPYSESAEKVFEMKNGDEKIYIGIFDKDTVITKEDLPLLFDEVENAPGSYVTYTRGWETDVVGMTLSDDFSMCYMIYPTIFTDVTFMLDENTVFKEYKHVKTYVPITPPTVSEYVEATNLPADKTLITWQQPGPHYVGPFDWSATPGYEGFLPLHEPTVYYPVIGLAGDTDQSGQLNTWDAVLILKLCAGIYDIHTAKIYPKTPADANRDDEITTADAVVVLKRIAGID